MNLEKKYDNYNNIVLALTKQYTNINNLYNLRML